jgi:hypothetical protein
MKLISISIFLLFSSASFCQGLEICSSLNTSSEDRFQNAYGFGFKYDYDFFSEFRVGAGIHYNLNKSTFIKDISYPYSPEFEEIISNSKRLSLRLNCQILLKDNEYVSFSVGPELSYNIIWSIDNYYYNKMYPNWVNYEKRIFSTKKFGVGITSSIEIKKMIIKKMSLCFSIRPELVVFDIYPKYYRGISDNSIFPQSVGFIEFQIGLKYRF